MNKPTQQDLFPLYIIKSPSDAHFEAVIYDKTTQHPFCVDGKKRHVELTSENMFVLVSSHEIPASSNSSTDGLFIVGKMHDKTYVHVILIPEHGLCVMWTWADFIEAHTQLLSSGEVLAHGR